MTDVRLKLSHMDKKKFQDSQFRTEALWKIKSIKFYLDVDSYFFPSELRDAFANRRTEMREVLDASIRLISEV